MAIQPPRPERYPVVLTQAARAESAIQAPIHASKMWITDGRIGQV
jgi:hypothetical protein